MLPGFKDWLRGVLGTPRNDASTGQSSPSAGGPPAPVRRHRQDAASPLRDVQARGSDVEPRAGVDETAGPASLLDPLAWLRNRDAYSLTETEFEELLTLERAEEVEWEASMTPTTKPIARSRLLSKTEEAAAVQVDNEGRPNLRLVPMGGQWVLTVPSGKVVDPRSTSIYRHDLFVVRVRGTGHYREANLSADASAGRTLAMKREPENEHDSNAVAVTTLGDARPLGYINRLNARRLAKRLDAGEELVILSMCGSPLGKAGDALTVLITRPDLLAHLRQSDVPRPTDVALDRAAERVITDKDVSG